MSGGFYGADVAELRQLAERFAAAADELTTTTRMLTHEIAAAHQWRGRDAEAFRRKWHATLRPVLVGTARGLEDGAGVLLQNAAAQERASGGGGGRDMRAMHAVAPDPRDVLKDVVGLLHDVDEVLVDALRRVPGILPWALGWPSTGVPESLSPDALDDLLFTHPVLMEAAARLLPYAAQAGVFQLVTATSALVASPVLMLGGALLVPVLSGGRWPTTDFERTIDGLIQLGGHGGLLQDSGTFHVAETRVPVGAAAPGGVADILGQQQLLGERDAQIQIIRRVQPDGTTAWVVQIPGTQEWSPFRGDNPIDLATNLALMAGRDSRAEEQVVAAMEAAGIAPGDPVMLTGHSQGGITAAALAADPSVADRFSIRSVVTAGSPIARFDIPPGVAVLALEHNQDAVPMLEGRENPSHWATVEHSLSIEDLAAAGREREPSLIAAHDPGVYARTGAFVDQSDDASLAAWRRSSAVFLHGGTAVVERYEIRPGSTGGW